MPDPALWIFLQDKIKLRACSTYSSSVVCSTTIEWCVTVENTYEAGCTPSSRSIGLHCSNNTDTQKNGIGKRMPQYGAWKIKQTHYSRSCNQAPWCIDFFIPFMICSVLFLFSVWHHLLGPIFSLEPDLLESSQLNSLKNKSSLIDIGLFVGIGVSVFFHVSEVLISIWEITGVNRIQLFTIQAVKPNKRCSFITGAAEASHLALAFLFAKFYYESISFSYPVDLQNVAWAKVLSTHYSWCAPEKWKRCNLYQTFRDLKMEWLTIGQGSSWKYWCLHTACSSCSLPEKVRVAIFWDQRWLRE